MVGDIRVEWQTYVRDGDGVVDVHELVADVLQHVLDQH